MADIEKELDIIQSKFKELIDMFGEGSDDNQEYKKLEETINNLKKQEITNYLGNINDTLIKQNPDTKQIITLLIPKDDNTIIQGVLHKNKKKKEEEEEEAAKSAI